LKPPDKNRLIAVITVAVAIKLLLFAFTAIYAPQGKFLPDSYGYLRLADTLAAKGVFGSLDQDGLISYEIFRTPGYPLFLAALHNIAKIPLNGVILLQIVLTLLAALITYKAAQLIDPRTAFLSVAIILFDPPITILSLTILTESLFLPLIALFLLWFTLYLKRGAVRHLAYSALALAAATYIRPISYYLGLPVFFFIVYTNMVNSAMRKHFWKHLMHTLVFLVIVYSALGLWQARNYTRSHDSSFCSAGKSNLITTGLYRSYARNTDPYTKGMAPLPYYVNVSFRSLLSVMTKPGTFKYFGNDALFVAGKVLGYPWMVFWLSGFIVGIFKMRQNIYIQFIFFVALYFISVSIIAQMWIMGDKLRVSIMPFIAIISAHGWRGIIGWLNLRRAQKTG
jgi:4-amino-4-deoxy-L-arabinose transferase-like glycosyltransferase